MAYANKHSERVAAFLKACNEESKATATNRGKAWTPEEDVVLLELKAEGWTYREIAQLTHRTFNATCNRMNRLLSGDQMTYATYDQSIREGDNARRKTRPVLCACGTPDEIHDDWCPANG